MRYFIIAIMVAILAGCATPAPVIDVKTQKVEVPVEVPCKVTVPPAPDYNFNKSKPTDSVFDKTKALLADRDLSLGYQAQLLAALNSCVK